MSDISVGDMVISPLTPHHNKIGLVIDMQTSNWGIFYRAFWEDGNFADHWNKFGCTPEIMKYETENPIRKSGFVGLLRRSR